MVNCLNLIIQISTCNSHGKFNFLDLTAVTVINSKFDFSTYKKPTQSDAKHHMIQIVPMPKIFHIL